MPASTKKCATSAWRSVSKHETLVSEGAIIRKQLREKYFQGLSWAFDPGWAGPGLVYPEIVTGRAEIVGNMISRAETLETLKGRVGL